MRFSVLNSLTPRELEILKMIAEGDSLPQIAKKIHRSPKTVQTHRLSLGRKLDAANRVELTRIAIAEGLVDLRPERSDEDTGEAKQRHQADAELQIKWLTEISQSVSEVKGYDYIQTICAALTRVLKVKYSAVCISTVPVGADDRFVVAMGREGKIQPSIRYSMGCTPVVQALSKGIVRIPDCLGDLYPNDPFVAHEGLKSYLGIRLNGDYGDKTAVYSVMHDKPLEHIETIEWLMRFFLARTSAELERIYQAQQIEKLKRLVDMQTSKSMPDGMRARLG